MRYIDSGSRNPSDALGTWLTEVLTPDVDELRLQAGFFNAGGLPFMQETLRRSYREDGLIHALIGSNDACTQRTDLERLVSMMGLPRKRALLGVVNYQNAFYHPKTIHVRRRDGDQAAYVGSANLTGFGVSSLHIEVFGVVLDSRNGDSQDVLARIAAAVDFWFDTQPTGLSLVSSLEDVSRLVADGILAEVRLARPAISPNERGLLLSSTARASLSPLVRLPQLELSPVETSEVSMEGAPIGVGLIPATPRPDFPPYLFFAPGQETPTTGIAALSGSSLPSGVSGLVIQLNRDSARHFEGRRGTANISIPVATLGTFRFGLFQEKYTRPRIEFALAIRYIGSDKVIVWSRTTTNIMAYGFISGESGHRDVRMLVPADVKSLAAAVRNEGKLLPAVGDVALLEWPTTNSFQEFRLSLMERETDLYRSARALFAAAQRSGLTVGNGACWLPERFSPPW